MVAVHTLFKHTLQLLLKAGDSSQRLFPPRLLGFFFRVFRGLGRPCFGVNASLETQLLAAHRVFDADIVLAFPVDLQISITQGGDKFFPVADQALGDA